MPRDSLSTLADAMPGPELLDINVTVFDGSSPAQLVNLRDPSRPVLSFRLTDLRKGLIALQLLDYNEALEKVACKF
ncbi:unnamed protein product [Protopolystoma xenopodis]|uniref:Uncharacterized protein n=1 Tax=Protopolystoma xenopodis TaxID=117903 RepID=A0A3S5BLT4_9PLAT|nr:unnamed protein product [Protopolystoma xenopodis]